MLDEPAARALAELLPGRRRKRWLVFMMHHPELEEPEFVGTLNLAVKALGGLGTAHITQAHSWDMELEEGT